MSQVNPVNPLITIHGSWGQDNLIKNKLNNLYNLILNQTQY